MMTSRLSVSALVVVCTASWCAADGVTFKAAPAGMGSASAVTDDGSTVLLIGGGVARLWRPDDDSVEIIGTNVYDVGGMTGDGSVVAATIDVGGVQVAAYWTAADGWTPIGGLYETGCDAFLSTAYDLSDDGSVIVGLGWEGCSGRAFRWEADTMEQLAQMGTRSARANGVSGDGALVGGWEEHDTGFRRPAYWDIDGNVHILAELPGEVWGFSADHSIMFGQLNADVSTTAALWVDGEHVDLGLLPGQDPFFSASYALAMSDDGALVGGTSGGTFPGDIRHAFLWDEAHGMRNVHDILTDAGVESLPPILGHVLDMTPDGTTIVGTVPDAFGFSYDGFIATLGGACDGDVDGDGTVGVTDLLAVLADWGDCPGCAADLDGDGTVGVGDLLLVLGGWGPC